MIIVIEGNGFLRSPGRAGRSRTRGRARSRSTRTARSSTPTAISWSRRSVRDDGDHDRAGWHDHGDRRRCRRIGSISLARFVNPGVPSTPSAGTSISRRSRRAMRRNVGAGRFRNDRRRFLEASNVNIVGGTGRHDRHRPAAAEINSKAIQASDEMLQTASNLRR